MEFAIEALTKPSEAQREEIRRLETDCRAHDGTRGLPGLAGPWDFGPETAGCFLARAGETLAGALAVFSTEKGEAAVTARVAPEYRRQGCFSAMLARAVQTLRARQVSELLLACDRESDDGFETAAALGGRLCRTETTLRCRAGEQAPAEVGGLRLGRCGPEDATETAGLAARVFGLPPEKAPEWAGRGADTQYRLLLTGVPVGLAAVRRQGGTAGIYRMGLIPEFRGQGLGKRMMALLLGDLFSAGGAAEAVLTVDGENAAACRLTLSGGFREETVTDYYRLALPEER